MSLRHRPAICNVPLQPPTEKMASTCVLDPETLLTTIAAFVVGLGTLGTNENVERFLCLRLANTATPLPSHQSFTGSV